MKKLSNEFLKDVVNKVDSSKPVFIIGGGPSLLTTLPDLTVLDKHYKITCNNAYQLYPDALAHHFMDEHWWYQHKEKMIDTVKGQITCSSVYNSHVYQNEPALCFGYDFIIDGISLNSDKLNGNNTGHQAINLAFLMGFKKIVLVGFDLDLPVNWHKDHTTVTPASIYEDTMIPGFDTIVPYQKKYGFTVYNTNQNSKLKCFKFANIKEFL